MKQPRKIVHVQSQSSFISSVSSGYIIKIKLWVVTPWSVVSHHSCYKSCPHWQKWMFCLKTVISNGLNTDAIHLLHFCNFRHFDWEVIHWELCGVFLCYFYRPMADSDKLSIDSIIARLLEGVYSKNIVMLLIFMEKFSEWNKRQLYSLPFYLLINCSSSSPLGLISKNYILPELVVLLLFSLFSNLEVRTATLIELLIMT